jgi:hypothetical protein
VVSFPLRSRCWAMRPPLANGRSHLLASDPGQLLDNSSG